MSIGTELIHEALESIGAHSLANPAGAESVERGRLKLNAMIQLWRSDNIDLGIPPLKAAGDEVGEPMDTRTTIVSKLALELAPLFSAAGQVVSSELRASANHGYSRVKALYQITEIPDKGVSSTLPLGAGNRRRLRGGQVFFGDGQTLNGDGGTVSG